MDMTFKDICIQNDKLTEAGERACQIVYAHYTGEPKHHNEAHITAHRAQSHYLAFSRDAWAKYMWGPIFSADHFAHWPPFFEELTMVSSGGCHELSRVENGTISIEEYAHELLTTDPVYFLETALRLSGKYCKWETSKASP